VRLLLDKKVDSRAKIKTWGQTALMLATMYGHKAVVQLLIDKKADIAAVDNYYGWTALHYAAQDGHEAVVQLLIDKKADIAAVDKDGRTTLMLAAKNGHKAVIRLLLDKKANMTAEDNDGWTVLHYAARYGHEAVVQLLLGEKADTTVNNKSGRTPLALAAEYGHEAVVQLLYKESNIALKDMDRWTALHYASQLGDEAIVRMLICNKADITAKSKTGRTALILAARYGHEAIVRLLMDKEADITTRDNDGWTALHFASRFGRKAIVELLVNEQVGHEVKGKNGRTALVLAAEYGHEAIVQLLIDKGADITARDDDGWTALHHAARYGHEAVIRLLADRGPNINARDNDGWTALHYAVRYGHEAVVELLVNEQADIEVKGKNGRTALVLAAEYGHRAIVQLLIDKRTDITARDGDGWTAPHHAARYGHEAVIRLLADKGADITARDNDGWTALHYALRYGYGAVAQLLVDKQANGTANSVEIRTVLALAAKNEPDAVVRLSAEEAANIIARDALLLSPPSQTSPHAAWKCKHPPLTGSRAIRILQLQPGKFSDPVRCSFETVTLDNCDIGYEAISYVWGTEEPDHEIWFPKGRFSVRTNLYLALLRFRKNATVRRLWVDAICIDQENTLERNQQILLMKDIYSSASMVLIWLGKDDALIRPAFQSIHEDVRKNEMSYLSDLSEERNHRVWDPDIASLFRSPWFERAWIYQEIVCSRAATVYCGSRDASQSISRNSLPWECLSKFYEIAEEVRALENVPTSSCSILGPLIFGRNHYNASDRIKNHFDLLTLLELRRNSSATDPRDKIFSLVGLSTEGQKGLIPTDYSTSVVDAYTNVTRLLINSRKDLRVLSAVQQSSGKSDLPSWVPDWREPWRFRPLISGIFKSSKSINDTQASFTATAGRPLELHCDGCLTELKLIGKPFARIQVLADLIPNTLDYGPTFSAKVAHLKDMGFPLQSKYPGTQLSYVAVLYSTIIMSQGFRDPQQELRSGASFSHATKLTENVASCRRLFLASNGYIGLVPADTAVGDEICLLFGGDVPYVLRERDQFHQFIGECYCYGIMNGEALQATMWEGTKTLGIGNFMSFAENPK
jgi:ankyrin repeat protein